MPIEHRKMITRPMLQAEPETLFVFGDNMLRKDLGGQAAEIRGEPNAVGIPTKNAPSNRPAAYFSDDDFDAAKPEIDSGFDRLETHLKSGGVVVWPTDGIGTGRADLEIKAPRNWDYVEARRLRLDAIAARD